MGASWPGESPAEADLVVPIPDSRHAGGDRLRPGVGHPVRGGLIKNRYVGRTLHPARPGAAPAGHQAQVQSARPRSRASASWWSTTRSCAATPCSSSWRCSSTPAPARCTCASPPSGPVALLLRHRHGRPRTSSPRPPLGRGDARADSAPTSLAYLSLEALQLALERPAGQFCRACFTGEYPIPIPDSSLKMRFEPAAPAPV